MSCKYVFNDCENRLPMTDGTCRKSQSTVTPFVKSAGRHRNAKEHFPASEVDGDCGFSGLASSLPPSRDNNNNNYA